MINKLICCLIFASSFLLSQQIDFYSPENIKSFGNNLFCEKDYLRAIDEYENYLKFSKNDSIQFKIAYSYLLINNFHQAINKFLQINSKSVFFENSKVELLKVYFLMSDSTGFYQTANSIIDSNSIFKSDALKLKNFAMLLSENMIRRDDFLKPFNYSEKVKALEFFNRRFSPPYKNELLAGILSALIPGSGKIYTQNYGDGVTAFILTGLFGYLAYTNFQHAHNTRAWIFTGLGSLFYAGNVYGSVASAQIFNAKVDLDFKNDINSFLENNNYFTPVYDFCK